MSALNPSMQPIVLFSIYQNNTLTIRRLVDETIDPATQRIILKIAGFFIYFLILLWDEHSRNLYPRIFLTVF